MAQLTLYEPGRAATAGSSASSRGRCDEEIRVTWLGGVLSCGRVVANDLPDRTSSGV